MNRNRDIRPDVLVQLARQCYPGDFDDISDGDLGVALMGLLSKGEVRVWEKNGRAGLTITSLGIDRVTRN